jgi:hypothetical protein
MAQLAGVATTIDLPEYSRTQCVRQRGVLHGDRRSMQRCWGSRRDAQGIGFQRVRCLHNVSGFSCESPAQRGSRLLQTEFSGLVQPVLRLQTGTRAMCLMLFVTRNSRRAQSRPKSAADAASNRNDLDGRDERVDKAAQALRPALLRSEAELRNDRARANLGWCICGVPGTNGALPAQCIAHRVQHETMRARHAKGSPGYNHAG